jgi:hypothetical protein
VHLVGFIIRIWAVLFTGEVKMGISEIISLCQEQHVGDIIKNKKHTLNVYLLLTFHVSGFGGLVDACWPLVPKFEGSNPPEAVGFFRAKKFPARLPSEGK